MRVLVDSCVWSLALRRRTGKSNLNAQELRLVESLAEKIRDGRVALVGPIRQEILSGIKHPEQFERVRERLDAFPDAPIDSQDYVQAARLDNLCRAAGVQCGTVDMLLCAIAQRNAWTILTNDGGLLRCIQAIEQTTVSGSEPPRPRLLEA